MNGDSHQPGEIGARRGVSVIIPCYKQAHLLPQAIDSVLAQAFEELEIIVVNDGSPDNTAAVAARYGNRIRYIEQSNQGLSAARNAGLRLATGEFVHFLDSDDFVRPRFYEKLSSLLGERTDVVAAYSGFQWMDPASQFVGEQPPVAEEADWFHRLLQGNPWPCHSLLVRASALAAAGPFDPKLKSCEDWDLWLRLAAVGGKFAPVAGFIGVCYRRSPESMSGNPWRMLETGFRVMERNAKIHGNCAKCRTSLALGLARHRDQCFDEKLIPRLGWQLEHGGLWRHLGACLRAFTYDRPSAWRGLKLLRHQKRRILAGLLHPKGPETAPSDSRAS